MKRLLIFLVSIGLFANEHVNKTIKIESNYYDHLAQMSVGNNYFIKPIRGKILDRKGKLLAVNQWR